MKVTKDFFTEGSHDVYEHRAEIEGRVLSARFVVSAQERQFGRCPPMDWIIRKLRHDMMAALEAELYKGTK